ncbi:hypothetical protein J6590_046670 [Homalodisca vitripennis]|nr:hypothetical protein J6590_046670 [Homalodisca vitripennis]
MGRSIKFFKTYWKPTGDTEIQEILRGPRLKDRDLLLDVTLLVPLSSSGQSPLHRIRSGSPDAGRTVSLEYNTGYESWPLLLNAMSHSQTDVSITALSAYRATSQPKCPLRRETASLPSLLTPPSRRVCSVSRESGSVKRVGRLNIVRYDDTASPFILGQQWFHEGLTSSHTLRGYYTVSL